MNITIEPGASALLDALHRAGFAAYAVGGCVRDSLLGLAPHDWDLCTAARPEQVMELFGEKQCIPTGLQHGTVTAVTVPCCNPVGMHCFSPNSSITCSGRAAVQRSQSWGARPSRLSRTQPPTA